MLTAAKIFLWLMIYSFAGWVYESILCSVTSGSLVNRGLLTGPYCPIYGFGALIVIFALRDNTGSILSLFLSSIVLTGILEYFTSWLLEKVFHAKWWDYSHYPFNINGRVCLYGALIFGLLSVLLMRVIHPVVEGLVDSLSALTVYIASGTLLTVISADFVITVRHILTMNGRLAEIQAALDGYRAESREKIARMRERLEERMDRPTLEEFKAELAERLEEFSHSSPLRARGEELLRRLEEASDLSAAQLRRNLRERMYRLRAAEQEGDEGGFEGSRFHSKRIRELLDRQGYMDRRLLKAFPRMRSVRYDDAVQKLREKLEKGKKKQ